MAKWMAAGVTETLHEHTWHQVLFPSSGLLQSTVGDKSFIVPHNGMLFIPANTPHKSIAVTHTEFLAIYLNPDSKVDYKSEDKSCFVTPFLKELILLIVARGLDEYSEEMITHLLEVLHDQIRLADSYEIPLLIPEDRRLKTIFSALNAQPDLPFTLDDWADKIGASQRTLSRLCAKEFNLSFSLWRQHIRLVLSLQRLEKKASIQEIALGLGYQSDAAYSHAFKGLFSLTPSQYRKRHLLAHH